MAQMNTRMMDQVALPERLSAIKTGKTESIHTHHRTHNHVTFFSLATNHTSFFFGILFDSVLQVDTQVLILSLAL